MEISSLISDIASNIKKSAENFIFQEFTPSTTDSVKAILMAEIRRLVDASVPVEEIEKYVTFNFSADATVPGKLNISLTAGPDAPDWYKKLVTELESLNVKPS